MWCEQTPERARERGGCVAAVPIDTSDCSGGQNHLIHFFQGKKNPTVFEH